jgi:MFS family permease
MNVPAAESARTAPAAPRPWAPLREPMFRAMWIAVLASNVGSWIENVATGWVMAEMTGSAAMLGLMQAAQTLPVVLLALLAGALADVVDRRVYLLVTQLWLMTVATALALLAGSGLLTPWLLLALTFAVGIGNAMAMPAQSATTPELVPKSMLAPAVALNSLGFNVARAIGPALGGIVLAQLGAAWAFGLNALSYLLLIVVLLRWKRAVPANALPPERIGGAIFTGLRYVRQAAVFRAVLVRAAAFFAFATALTALLPLVVKEELGAGPNAYGLLLAAIGLGAIGGALLLPWVKTHLDRDRLVLIATCAYAATMVGMALLDRLAWLLPVALLTGLAWISVLASLQVAAQTSVPGWVRARALSLYIVVFSLGQAVGSLAWGAYAQQRSIDEALLLAAGLAVLAGFLALRWRIAGAEQLDHTPSAHWPQPIVATEVEGERAPAVITIEYRIDPAQRRDFLALMGALGHVRRRDGALDWQCVEDVSDPGTYLEVFRTGSWLEHLRQHQRVTADDRALQQKISALHLGPDAPRVRHFVGGEPGSAIAPHGPGLDA